MRVKEYKYLETVVNKLRDVVTQNNYKEITGSMQECYRAIAEQRTHISSNYIERIYSLGTVDNVYHILVVYNRYYTKDIMLKHISGIIESDGNYFDVSISFAGTDIYDSLPIAYTVIYNTFYPAPADDLYYLYCFFNAFRGIYTHNDIKVTGSDLTDTAISALEKLLANYYGPGYIPTEIAIAKCIRAARLENTDKKTE